MDRGETLRDLRCSRQCGTEQSLSRLTLQKSCFPGLRFDQKIGVGVGGGLAIWSRSVSFGMLPMMVLKTSAPDDARTAQVQIVVQYVQERRRGFDIDFPGFSVDTQCDDNHEIS